MGYGESTSERIEEVARAIVDAAYKVHLTLGPGLLESVYKTCLAYELRKRGFLVECERKVPILYDGVQLDADLKMDLLVEDCVIVEVKSVQTMHPVFTAQAITYLKLSSKRLCLLINFNVALIKDGIKRARAVIGWMELLGVGVMAPSDFFTTKARTTTKKSFLFYLFET